MHVRQPIPPFPLPFPHRKEHTNKECANRLCTSIFTVTALETLLAPINTETCTEYHTYMIHPLRLGGFKQLIEEPVPHE